MKGRCETNRTKHLVVCVSKFGWSFVSSVEECEGRVGHLDMSTLRAQEKAYLQHKMAVGGKSSDSDDPLQRGRWYNKNQKKKAAAAVGACSALSRGVFGSQRGRARLSGGRGLPDIFCEGVYFLLTFFSVREPGS